MGAALICVVVFCATLATTNNETEKIDPIKFVGTWEKKENPNAEPALIKFPRPTIKLTKDAKITITVYGSSFYGTYKVNGNKITVKETLGTETLVNTLTVVKLTDTELIMKGDAGTEEYARLKDE